MLTITGHLTPAGSRLPAVGTAVRKSGELPPAGMTSTDYCYVPFDVPAGISRVDIHYAYSHPLHHADVDGEGNTIDLGLFDPRGHEFLKADGFRGWSGSDRSHIWLAETAADTAPGYLAGPIPAGRWHVILGLYRIAPEGCDYSVTIDLTPRLPDKPVPATLAVGAQEQASQQARGAGWYRGDLQSHTHHSDAKGSLATLVATARARGLDFLAVTDHNTVSHIREFAQVTGAAPHRPDGVPTAGSGGPPGSGPLLIPAMEVTTYYGHMNVWGVRDWVDFRCRDAQDLNQVIAAVHQQGGLASVNHPKTGGPPWEYGSDLDFDCIEVWQAPWPFYNPESFAWWESLLKQGRRVVAVGGSDYHQPEKVMEGNPHLLGHPTTWVYAPEYSVAGILEGIRRGHVFIAADVNGPLLYFTASDGRRTYQAGDVLGQLDTNPHSDKFIRADRQGARREEPWTTGQRDTSPHSDKFIGAGRQEPWAARDESPQASGPEPAPDLELTIRVQHGAGYFARLIADGDVVAELPVDSADWTHTWPSQPWATGQLDTNPHSDKFIGAGRQGARRDEPWTTGQRDTSPHSDKFIGAGRQGAHGQEPWAAHYLRAEVIIRHSPSDWLMAACTNPIYC